MPIHIALADSTRDLQQLANHFSFQHSVQALSISTSLPFGESYQANSGMLNEHSNIPITAMSEFQVGAVTETFVAALILQLEAEGKFNIHDSISYYLPKYPAWRTITIQQLLNHTSGLYDFTKHSGWNGALNLHSTKVWTLSELADLAYANKPYSTADIAWRYNPTDYILLGIIAENVTGATLAELITERFIIPFHLSHTYYAYRPISKQQLGNLVVNERSQMNISWLGSAGALVSSTSDLLKWDMALFNGEILKAPQMQELLRFIAVEGGKPLSNYQNIGYNAGIFIVNTPVGIIYYSPGDMPGYQTGISYMPCLGLAVSYSVANGAVITPKSIQDLLIQIYQTMLAEAKTVKRALQFRSVNTIPAYCEDLPPSKSFHFVAI